MDTVSCFADFTHFYRVLSFEVDKKVRFGCTPCVAAADETIPLKRRGPDGRRSAEVLRLLLPLLGVFFWRQHQPPHAAYPQHSKPPRCSVTRAL